MDKCFVLISVLYNGNTETQWFGMVNATYIIFPQGATLPNAISETVVVPDFTDTADDIWAKLEAKILADLGLTELDFVRLGRTP